MQAITRSLPPHSGQDLAVLERQLAEHDPLTTEERGFTFEVHSDAAPADILARLLQGPFQRTFNDAL